MPQSSKDIWISSTYKHKWILKKKVQWKKWFAEYIWLIAFTQNIKNL